MAKLWITEYAGIGVAEKPARQEQPPVALEPAVADQAVTFSTAAQSAVFQGATKVVRLVADADCHVLFGEDPAANATHQKLIAGGEYWRAVKPGHRLSVYDGSS